MTRTYFPLPDRYHQALPDRIRAYLNGRGIADHCLERFKIGWNGYRITLPVWDRDGKFRFFRLARDPEDVSTLPKMLSTPGSTAELYGWDTLAVCPSRVIICEGEFDRLVLESRGYAAVTSTAGAHSFKAAWADAIATVPDVYICFDRDEAGHAGAQLTASLIPNARIVTLPDEVGPAGDVSDYFVRLGKSAKEFESLLESAAPCPSPHGGRNATVEYLRRRDTDLSCEIDRLKQAVPIERTIASVVVLRPSGRRFTGRCPFHADRTPSFVVYPDGPNYYCFGCGARGDVIDFLMRSQVLTFTQALTRLRQMAAGLSNHP